MEYNACLDMTFSQSFQLLTQYNALLCDQREHEPYFKPCVLLYVPSSHGNNTQSQDEWCNKGELLHGVSLCSGLVIYKRNEWEREREREREREIFACLLLQLLLKQERLRILALVSSSLTARLGWGRKNHWYTTAAFLRDLLDVWSLNTYALLMQ